MGEPHAADVLFQAEQTLAEAGRWLSLADAARWLQTHGVSVHHNTVRYWARIGHLRVERRRRSVMVRLATLEHIAACPLCAHRGNSKDLDLHAE